METEESTKKFIPNMSTKIKGIRTNCVTNESKEVDLVVATRYYECMNGEKWASFYIKEGAVTGYESFHITQQSVIDLSYGWCACAGTKNRWDELHIDAENMQKAFKEFGLI